MQIKASFESMKELMEFCSAFTGGQGIVPLDVVTTGETKPASETPVSENASQPVHSVVPDITLPVVTPAQTPVTTVNPAVTPIAQVPVSTPTYSLDDLARAAMTLMDSGRQEELRQLLASFGVDALPALPQEKYGAFATALREKGAQI